MLRGCFQSLKLRPGCPLLPRGNLLALGSSSPWCAARGVRRVSSPRAGSRMRSDSLKNHFGGKKSQGPKGEGALGGWLGRLFRGCHSFCLCPSPCSVGPVPTESSHFIPGVRDGQTDSPGAGGQCWERRWGVPAWEMPVACAGIAEVEAHGASWGNWILSPSFGPGSPLLVGGGACSPWGAGGALPESSHGGASETAFDAKSATKGS